MFRLLILCSTLFITTANANDCAKNLECGKCDRKSEFAWNPDASFISNELSYFYQLPEIIESHYQNGNLNAVDKYANDYLDLAAAYRCNWNYGNAIHEANRYLGLISLKKKDTDRAAMYLVRASHTPGSMQLGAFGPELDLANLLLKKGKNAEVIEYLNRMNLIWDNDQQVNKWISKIETGKKPYLQRPSEAQLQQRFASKNIF